MGEPGWIGETPCCHDVMYRSVVASSNEVVPRSPFCGLLDFEHAENQPLRSQSREKSRTLGYAARLRSPVVLHFLCGAFSPLCHR